MVKCKICDRDFNSMQSLAKHVKRTHQQTSEEYYLRYIGDRVICACGTPTTYRNMVVGYSTYCSSKCAYHDASVSDKRESTMITRYGTSHAISSSGVRDKIKHTMVDKYGVESPFHSASILKKANDTVMTRYGVSNVMSLDSVKLKRKTQSLDTYGVEYPMQHVDVQHKAQDTMMNRYGVRFSAQSDEIRSKQINTNIERYGVEVATQNDNIKQKIASTNMHRYGYTTPLKNDEIQTKSEKTCLSKYGVRHPGSSKASHDKRKRTTLEKYGVDSVFLVSDVQDKIKSTIISRYGVENIAQSRDIKERIKQLGNKKVFDSNVNKFASYDCTLTGYANQSFTYTCTKCGAICEESYQFIRVCRFDNNVSPCTTCFPKQSGVSFMEREVSAYIDSIYDGIIVHNDTSIIPPKELDIYLPERGIAIEFNGLFYHSEIYKESDYHLNKTEQCNENGIHLIHIYEDDWIYKSDIVKSRIKNLLGQSDCIYARKCTVKSVSSSDAREFLDRNHIQGNCGSSHKYGLYYNHELISLMTFGKSRFSSEYELIRFCNKLNTTVVGGASKLFKYFMRIHSNVDSIVSYADRSWSTGGLYETLGFYMDSITAPGYSYVNGNIRENRMKYQKHKLVKDGYDPTMTEHDIMLSRKLYRIYDSGHLKYKWLR